MPKILTIVGARPQFIKASALSRALLAVGLPEVLVHTGQHFDDNMADIFFREMEIPEPVYTLGIHSLSHGAMTGRMTEEIEKILLAEKPSAVVVYGDTNSTLAGALAAVKLHIPVAHVEAGLRSFNMEMPEEVNRILTDRISSWLFCPTDNAVRNLEKEGFNNFSGRDGGNYLQQEGSGTFPCRNNVNGHKQEGTNNFPVCVENCGDVMYDVALHYSQISAGKSTIMKNLSLTGKSFVLATLHRQENTDDPERLASLLDALNSLSSGTRIVLPLHPRTRKIMEDENLRLNFEPLEPVGYFDMVELLKNCSFVLTDSGGVQKEAFFFKKHCLVARDETEWTELTDLGYNFIVGTDRNKILETSERVFHLNMPFTEMPFGSGDAALKITRILKDSIH